MHTTSTFGRLFLTALAVGAAARAASAELITSAADVDSPAVIDFSQFIGNGYNFTNGPTHVGALVGLDVVFTSTNPNTPFQSVLGEGRYTLGDNGEWEHGPGGNAYAGLDFHVGSITFSLNGLLVSAIGGFINYLPQDAVSNPVTIEVLGADHTTVLETYVLSGGPFEIVTPGGFEAGAFRGIRRATADIGALRLSNAYVVLDDLALGPVAPTPIEVTLDVKPDSIDNPVNIKSALKAKGVSRAAGGVLPVAVLADQTFDPALVDVSTVLLGDPLLAGTVTPVKWHAEDVDSDGDLDLVIHFSLREMVLNGAIDSLSTSLCLHGATREGIDIEGRDDIQIVPAAKPPKPLKESKKK
jgi:hypothetical protein